MKNIKRISGFKILDNGKFHAVRYLYQDGLPPLELIQQGIYRLKSGISSDLTSKQYKSETVRTDSTGKKFIMWDDSFLHQNITEQQAGEIIALMDKTFKQIMKQEGYNSREIHNDRSIGTEFYEHNNKEELIEIIKYTWAKAYRIAFEYVTKSEMENNLELIPFQARYKQDTLVINPVVEHFKTFDLGTIQAHGGIGKTKTSFEISRLVCQALDMPWKILTFADTRPNAVQLTYEFAKFYKGQTGEKLMDIYFVGSVDSKDYRLLEAWANVYPVSNKSKIKEALIDCYNSSRPCAWFVVNRSAERFLQIAKQIKVNFKKYFTIIDEIHQYANEVGTPKMVSSAECAVVAPRYADLFGKKLGLSATHVCRPDTIDDLEAIFNDDIDKFGIRIVDIDEIKARALGWISEGQGMVIPLPTTPEMRISIEEKRPLSLTLGNEVLNINPVHYVAIEGIRRYITPLNKTHILILAAFIKDVKDIADLFRRLQELGHLDSEFDIIEGFASCGNSCVNRFNKAKKAIMIATRWVGVGQDTYMCDCVFPLYNPASMAYSKQFSMRKDRWVENKVSLLAFTEFEHRLEENIWYSRLESLSNGLSPDIISEAEFATIVDRPLGGNNRNPNGGTAIPNITIVRSNNHDPIFFANFIELGNQIGTRTYTDENGDTYFSRMKKAFEKSPQRVRDEAYKAFNEGKKWSEFAHIIVNGQKRCSLMYDYASEFKMVEEIKAIWGLKYQGKIDVNIAKERILPYKGMSVEERYKKQITDHLFSNALNWLRKNNYKHIILEIFPDYKFEKGASKFKVISDNELLEKIVDIIKQTTFSNVEVISRELNRQNISGGKKKIETLMQSKQFKKLVGNNKINIKNKLTNSQLISKIRKIKKQYNTTSYDKIAKVLRECGFSISNTRVKEQCDKVFKK